jgi:hypothetical protein
MSIFRQSRSRITPPPREALALELAVEMDLVASEPLQLVGVEGFAKRLLPDQRPVG